MACITKNVMAITRKIVSTAMQNRFMTYRRNFEFIDSRPFQFAQVCILSIKNFLNSAFLVVSIIKLHFYDVKAFILISTALPC